MEKIDTDYKQRNLKSLAKLFKPFNPDWAPLSLPVPLYTPGWREALSTCYKVVGAQEKWITLGESGNIVY